LASASADHEILRRWPTQNDHRDKRKRTVIAKEPGFMRESAMAPRLGGYRFVVNRSLESRERVRLSAESTNPLRWSLIGLQ
jgi:hypothetical protein